RGGAPACAQRCSRARALLAASARSKSASAFRATAPRKRVAGGGRWSARLDLCRSGHASAHRVVAPRFRDRSGQTGTALHGGGVRHRSAALWLNADGLAFAPASESGAALERRNGQCATESLVGTQSHCGAANLAVYGAAVRRWTALPDAAQHRG